MQAAEASGLATRIRRLTMPTRARFGRIESKKREPKDSSFYLPYRSCATLRRGNWEFERLVLDEDVELDVDSAITSLAVLLCDPHDRGQKQSAADGGGRDPLRVGLNEWVVVAVKRRH